MLAPFILLFHLLFNVTPYPIAPVFINELIEKSAFIVEAEVVKVEYSDSRDSYPCTAELEIITLLRGEINSKSIKVNYMCTMACPAPPTFNEGEKLLAFLNKKNSFYHVTGLSYGTKYFKDPVSASTYKERTHKYLEIIEAPVIDTQEVKAFLVESLCMAPIKKEIIRILNRSAKQQVGSLSSYDLRKRPKSEKRTFPYVEFWEDKYKAAIRDEIMQDDETFYYTPELLSAVYNPDDLEYEDFLLDYLSKNLQKGFRYVVVDIVNTIDIEGRDPSLKELKQKINAISKDYKRKDVLIEYGFEYYDLIKQ